MEGYSLKTGQIYNNLTFATPQLDKLFETTPVKSLNNDQMPFFTHEPLLVLCVYNCNLVMLYLRIVF